MDKDWKEFDEMWNPLEKQGWDILLKEDISHNKKIIKSYILHREESLLQDIREWTEKEKDAINESFPDEKQYYDNRAISALLSFLDNYGRK